MRSILSLLTALLLLLPSGNAFATNVEDSLILGIQSTKTTLIRPLEPEERDIKSLYGLIYESLVVIDDDYLPKPCLAESWEQTGAGKTWTLHLRKDVTFSDGTPLTAYDVAATGQYILDRANDENVTVKGYYANLNYFVDKITATGDYTIVVKAKRSYFGVLYALTFPILKASEVTAENPLGTGPYIVTHFSAGDYMFLEYNPNWWQNTPQVREISVMMYNTPSLVIEAYEYGRVDTVFTRSIAAAQYKSGTTSLAIASRTNQLETLLMNHSSSKLGSINVRKAIRYAVDPDKIASTVYMGMVNRTNTPMIPGTWMYNDSVDGMFKRDVEAAKALLEADGWDDSNEDGVLDRVSEEGKLVNLAFTLLVYEEPDNNVRYEAANVIAEELAEIGIDVTVTTVSYADMLSKLTAGNFQLALASFAMDACPDPGFMLMSGNSGNYCRYKSSAMTDLCKGLRTCVTQGEYQQVLHQIQQQFANDCPFICLFYRSGAILSRRMYTTVRDVRELELLRGIEKFHQ